MLLTCTPKLAMYYCFKHRSTLKTDNSFIRIRRFHIVLCARRRLRIKFCHFKLDTDQYFFIGKSLIFSFLLFI